MAELDDQLQQYRDQLNQILKQPAAMPTGTPDDGSSPSWTGLLGRALSGGQAPGYRLRGSEADTSGNRALLNFGIQTLLASGPAPVRPDVFSAVASGLQGAQQSMDVDQRRAAALATAQYGAAREQRQDQLAALKEALPLLTLQQQQTALAKLKGEGSTSTATTPGGGGGGGAANNPLNIRFANQPGATNVGGFAAFETPEAGQAATDALFRKYAEGGINTLAAFISKWAPPNENDTPGYIAKVAAATGLDPTKPIDFRDPAVARRVQIAMAAVEGNKNARPPSPAGGPPAAPGAPAAPPGVQVGGPAPPPPGGPSGPSGPPSPGAGGVAQALPPSGAPTTVLRETQERGPDGKVRTVVRPMPATPPTTATAPSGQQVSSNVGAILGGMEQARTATPASAMPMVGGPGAGPTAQPQPRPEAGWGTGAPTGYGGGSPPPGMVTPATPATAPIAAPPAATPPPAMAVPPPFQMRPLTPTEQAATSYDLPPDVAAGFKKEKDAAVTVPEWQQADQKEKAALLARRTEADAARLKIEHDARTEHNTLWQKQQDVIAARESERIKEEAAAARALKLEQVKAETAAEAARIKEAAETARLHATAAETRLTNREAVVNSVNQKGLETANAEQAASIGAVRQLEGFRSVSEMVGQPGWMQTTKFPGSEQSVAERLQQLGWKQDDTAGVQLMRGAMTNLTRTLREGMPMGALSDRDLSFIERMGPTEWMDPETRIAAVDYLQKAFRAKQRFAFEVQREMGRGKNHGDALDAANETVKDFVPKVSPELASHWGDNSQEWSDARKQWAIDHDVRPGTMFHFPNGSVAIMKRPKPAGAP